MPTRISILAISFVSLAFSLTAHAQSSGNVAEETDDRATEVSEPSEEENAAIRETSQPTEESGVDDRETSEPTDESDTEDDDVEEIEDFVVVDNKNEKEKWFSENYLRIDRTINLLTAKTLRKNALQFTIDHRAWEPMKDEPFHDFLGLDAGSLKITLGLRYGLFDFLDVGLLRNSNGTDVFDTYEFDTRVHLLKQDEHYIDLAIRGGLSWFSQKDAEDALDVFAQLILNREFLYHFFVGTGLLFHNESSSDTKTNLDDHWSMAIPFSFDVRFLDWLAWNAEVVTSIAGYNGKYPQIATSIKFITARHSFALVVTNSQYMVTADGVVSNTDRKFDELVIGFSVVKEFNL